jgi:exopolysaccharide biosynthesis polyprenyl glycosylphosphotransferase
MIAILVIWSFLLFQFNAYRSYRAVSIVDETVTITQVAMIGGILVGTFAFVFQFKLASRTLIVLFMALNVILLVLERSAVRAVSWSFRKKGYNYRNVLIVGTGAMADEMCSIINKYQHWGLRVVGVVADQDEDKPEKVDRRLIIGKLNDLENIINNYVVDEVIFALPGKIYEQLEDKLLLLEEQGISVRLSAKIFPHVIAKINFEELETIPLLTFTTVPTDHIALGLKRVFDIFVSSLLIALSSPIMLSAVVAIKLTSKGPILFRQRRCGLNGRIFTLYKFRSMSVDAETRRKEMESLNEMEGPVFKIKDDPRVTTIGRFIRKTSIDELPQLWNVLRGDMSIVGPRPPIPEEVGKYERWQRRRLSMRPGITCLWQIGGRNNIANFDDWVRLDLQYIDTWSLSLDLKIFLKTIPVVLFQKGAA